MNLEERLLNKVQMEPNSGCWIWEAATNGDGYGYLNHGGKQWRAHRLSYELFKCEIPPGLELDHLCRLRCCVNPDHLEAVTRSVNAKRGDTGKRHTRTHILPQTNCQRGHEFTPENTGIQKGGRFCRICSRAKVQAYRARQKEKLL